MSMFKKLNANNPNSAWHSPAHQAAAKPQQPSTSPLAWAEKSLCSTPKNSSSVCTPTSLILMWSISPHRIRQSVLSK